jgi:7-cyano-7-deazaguanine reductase
MPPRKPPAVSQTRVPLLEVFPNPHPGRTYEIEIEAPEFTSVCPRTGQPDFGTVRITYIPARACIELKSLKFYLQQYRTKGIFYEDLTNRILHDMVSACAPRWMRLVTEWRPRGGITTRVTAEHGRRAAGARRQRPA